MEGSSPVDLEPVSDSGERSLEPVRGRPGSTDDAGPSPVLSSPRPAPPAYRAPGEAGLPSLTLDKVLAFRSSLAMPITAQHLLLSRLRSDWEEYLRKPPLRSSPGSIPAPTLCHWRTLPSRLTAGPAPFPAPRQAPPFICRTGPFSSPGLSGHAPSAQGRSRPLMDPHASSSRSQSPDPTFISCQALFPPTRSQAPPPACR